MMNDPLMLDGYEAKSSNLSRLVATLSDRLSLKCALYNSTSRKFTYFSESFIQFLGYERLELPSNAHHLIRLIADSNDDSDLFLSLLDGTVKSKIPILNSVIPLSMVINLYTTLRGKSGSVVNVCFTAFPFHVNACGEPTIFIVTLKQNQRPKHGHTSLFYFEGDKKYEYIPQRKKFVLRSGQLLKPIELEILKLAAAGQNEQKMAKVLGHNLTYIKYYKKRLFLKLNVDSIAEAVYVALKAKLI